jgi:cytochrome b pre-mRNA-processing protein 3
VLLAYDEGLVKGDAMLAAAVWRNLFGGREDVDFEKLAMIVGYMRRELARLVKASDNDVAMGEWQFQGDPGDEAKTLNVVSKLMKDGASK